MWFLYIWCLYCLKIKIFLGLIAPLVPMFYQLMKIVPFFLKSNFLAPRFSHLLQFWSQFISFAPKVIIFGAKKWFLSQKWYVLNKYCPNKYENRGPKSLILVKGRTVYVSDKIREPRVQWNLFFSPRLPPLSLLHSVNTLWSCVYFVADIRIWVLQIITMPWL